MEEPEDFLKHIKLRSVILPLETPSVSTISSEGPYTMTQEDLAAKLSRGSSGKFFTQVYTCFVCAFGSFSLGLALGWANPAVIMKGQYFESHVCSWASAIVPLGCSVGVWISGVMMTKLGPKRTINYQLLFYILMWVLLFRAKKGSEIITIRFFLGLFGVSSLICGDRLLADTLHVSMYLFGWILFRSSLIMGVWSIAMLGAIFPFKYVTISAVAIPVLQGILLHFMPESPVFLYSRGEQHAENAIIWYQGKDKVSENLRKIRKDYEYKHNWEYYFYSKVVLKGFFIVVGTTFFQVFSGYYTFLFFGTLIWSDNYVISPSADAMYVGFIMYFSNIFWSFIHRKFQFQVRLPLMISCFGVALFAALLALFLYLYEMVKQLADFKWCGFILMGSLSFMYEVGLSYYPMYLAYQYLPFQIYPLACMILHALFWLLVFAMTKIYCFWRTVYPVYTLFCLLSLLQFTGFIYIYFFVVETKDKSLIQIQCSLGGNPVGNRASHNVRGISAL